jgi:hypothetical protein
MKSIKIPLGDILRIRNNNPCEFNLLSFHGTRIRAHPNSFKVDLTKNNATW